MKTTKPRFWSNRCAWARLTALSSTDCSILKQFVRPVLQVGGCYLAILQTRARFDFPASHESSLKCAAFKRRALRGQKLAPMATDGQRGCEQFGYRTGAATG